MENKNILLWTIALLALVAGIFSVVQSRVNPLKSDASYNPNIRQITRQDIGPITSAGQDVGDSCVIVTFDSNGEILGTIEGIVEGVPGSNETFCVVRDSNGNVRYSAPIVIVR